jgi:SET domain-containing protein
MPDGAQQPRRRPRSKPKLDPAFCRYRLSAHESAIHRYGIFAEEPIPASRKVIEYTGERITDEQGWRRRFRKHVYLFSLQSGDLIDGAVGGSGAEFINHSCEPNVVAREQKGRIWYSSLRRIEPGEELTVDYRLDSDEEYECICGAPSCRGKLNAPKASADQ